MAPARAKLKDFVLWNFGLVPIVVIHYSTKTQGTPLAGMINFFTLVWIVSTFGLIGVKVLVPEKKEVADYDENLRRSHLDYLIGGIVAVELVAVVFAVIGTLLDPQSTATAPLAAMYVPRMSVSPTLFRFYDDILVNFALVSTAEENIKTLAKKLLQLKFAQPGLIDDTMTTMIPVAFWSMLHGYHAYTTYSGFVMWMMIGAAFFAGILMMYITLKTKCIINAYIIHGSHNSLVVLASFVGQMSLFKIG